MKNKFANAFMMGQAVTKGYFRLQQFADDGDNGADEGSGDGDSGESGEEDSGSEGSDNGEGTKTYTDADVNAIIERKMAEWSKKKDKEISEVKAEAENWQKRILSRNASILVNRTNFIFLSTMVQFSSFYNRISAADSGY